MPESEVQKTPECLVASILDSSTVVITWGATQGVSPGQSVAIFRRGPRIKHPKTGEDLGSLEVVKGYGTVISTQEKMSVVVSEKNNFSGRDAFKADAMDAMFVNALTAQIGSLGMTVKIGDSVKLI